MKIEKEKLRSFLVDLDLITEEGFKRIEKKAEENRIEIGDLLISEEILDEERLTRIKAHILGIPFIDLEKVKIPSDLLTIVSENFARANKVVPFSKEGDKLQVAMTDPEELEVIETIKKSTGLNVLPRLTTPKSVKNVLDQYEDNLETEISRAIDLNEEGVRVIEETGDDDENLEETAKELPVVKIVDILIKHAILQRASDIHIEPQDEELIVRYRIDGILRDAMNLPIEVASGVVARIKVLSNLKLDEHRLPQDGRFKVENKDYKYSLRVSVLPVSGGEKVVMRLLPESAETFELEETGMRGVTLERVRESLRKRSGMILVTGPTGSGKTTTLYSILDKLNTPEVNISTVEDPIEYQVPRINQTQVKPKIGFTFASGLRSLVRQDPDVLMVGEIRDTETARLATNAALTGHLVLSTLHTTNAAGAASRLIDMEVEPFLVSSTVNVVIAQRLLRKLHSSKEPYQLSDGEIRDLENYCDLDRVLSIMKEMQIIEENQGIKDIQFFRPVETEDSPDGYRGRIGAYEALTITENLKKMIIDRASSSEIKEEAIREGMITMVEDGIIKAALGITSVEEVLRVLIE